MMSGMENSCKEMKQNGTYSLCQLVFALMHWNGVKPTIFTAVEGDGKGFFTTTTYQSQEKRIDFASFKQ